MIPIVSIGNLISFIVALAITLKLYFVYQEKRSKRVNDFFKIFLFLSVYFGLLATPELVFKDPKTIELVSLEISFFFIYLALAYLIKISLEILDWKKLKNIYFWGLIVFAFMLTIINIATLQPAVYSVQGQFVFWEDARGIVINIITGFILGVGSISGALFFLIGGLKSTEKLVRTRSFLITGGLVMMALAALINYILGASPQIFMTSIIASLLVIIGLLTVFTGVFYKHAESH